MVLLSLFHLVILITVALAVLQRLVRIEWLIASLRLELLITDTIQLFENIDQHRLLCFNTCLVRIPYEVHVDLPIASLLLLLNRPMERVFFIELVKVFVANLGSYRWNIWRLLLPQALPINVGEERMVFDFFRSVLAQPVVRVAYQFSQDVFGGWRELCFGRNIKRLLPMHDLLASNSGFV